MNRYTIWQVRKEHLRDYGFRSLDYLQTRGLIRREEENAETRATARAAPTEGPGLFVLPREIWEAVYVCEAEKDPSLDWLFQYFYRCNSVITAKDGPPEDFTGHSLSVSDIIETPDGKLWYCEPFSWEEVRWES